MFYILHGENELQRAETLTSILKKIDIPPDLRDLNTEVLEPPVSIGELRRACSTIPFLGGARIVIARDAMGKDKGALSKEFAAYLPDMPPSTHLIFTEQRPLSKRNAVLKLAQKQKNPVLLCELPKANRLPQWIQQRTQKYGGRIEARAAAMLAQNIGGNLRILDQEIQKLLLYCADSKMITAQDVEIMVPYVQSADVIFNLVDAVGQRNPRNAAIYLHRLLEVGEHPLGIFGMIVRQFRLLIQVRWLVDRQYSAQEIVARLKLHPYVARKVQAQAIHFTPDQLKHAYRLLAESDLAIKQGQLSAEAALDLLIAQLTRL